MSPKRLAYATAFQQRFSNIVAEERYVQDVTYRNVALNRFAIVTHRELRSDLLLVRLTARTSSSAMCSRWTAGRSAIGRIG